MAQQMLSPAANNDRPRPNGHEEQPDIARDFCRADNIRNCHHHYSDACDLNRPEASARAEPHPRRVNSQSDHGASKGYLLVKPLASGHSSGTPVLPYGIGVSDVPNHAEHITSRGTPKDATTICRETPPRSKPLVAETCAASPKKDTTAREDKATQAGTNGDCSSAGST